MGVSSLGFIALVGIFTNLLCSDRVIGGDEAFEVTKGLLWANGYSLYAQIWSDQPPLFTVILGTLFKVFGASMAVAHATALIFGLVLAVGLFLVVEKRSGALAAFVATASLLTAPIVLTLSVSAMQEVPAIGTSLWAVWLVQQWTQRHRSVWLIASGVVLAIALLIKLTAAVVVPALVFEILLAHKYHDKATFAKKAFHSLTKWACATFGTFLTLGLLLGFDFTSVVSLHFSTGVAHSNGASLHTFSLWELLESPDALLGAIVSIWIVVLLSTWRIVAFPFVMLATVTIIHLYHRPWWDFYYLHFVVPFAWLTGYSVTELIKAIRGTIIQGSPQRQPAKLGMILIVMILVSLLILQGGNRIILSVDWIRSIPPLDTKLIAKMRENRSRTNWVYTPDIIYPFCAGLNMIPELAVISYKRFWSKEITNEEILIIVKRYKPEQLLIHKSTHRDFQNPWQILVEEYYTPVYENEDNVLFLAKGLVEK